TQPFRNTMVRIPCPSWMEYLWISKILPFTCVRSSILEPLLGSADDIILQTLGESGKQRGISGHAHHQVPVIFRMLLGVQQRLSGNHIALHVTALPVEVGADQADKIVQSPVAAEG